MMSLHSQFLQYMPFVGVITPTSRLHSVGSRNTKVFEKSRIPNPIEDLSITIMRQKKTYCNLEKKLLLLSGGNREKTFDGLIMRKCQNRYGIASRLKLLYPLHMQHVLWIYHQIKEWRGGNVLDPIKWD